MGTIRKTPAGHYRAQIYLGKLTDTRKPRFDSRTFRTRKEAEQWVTSTEGQRNDGLYRPTLSKVTLSEYLRDSWLPLYRTQVRSTYTIEKVLGKWIFRPQPDTPYLGRIRLHKLTVAEFDRLYLAMASHHALQRRGIEQLHAILKRALKAAVRKGELPRNPAEFATIPKPNVTAEIRTEADEDDVGPVRYLSKEQAARFLAVAKNDRLSALWHLLLDAGLRPGEAFALTWGHIDIDARLVTVRRTLMRVRGKEREDAGKGWKVMPPKTASSNGSVPISKTTAEELKRWKARQNRERLALGAEWHDHGFVFTTASGYPLGNNLRRSWVRLLREADGGRGDLGVWGEARPKPRNGPTPGRSFKPAFNMYVLRHTCATLALLDGVDLLQVSRRLRHKNIGITARFYGHLNAEHTTRAAESFDRLATSV